MSKLRGRTGDFCDFPPVLMPYPQGLEVFSKSTNRDRQDFVEGLQQMGTYDCSGDVEANGGAKQLLLK